MEDTTAQAAGLAVTIRPEDSQDHAAVHGVVGQAFGSDVVAELVNVLRSSTAYVPGLSFVAEAGGAVVGHVMLTRSWVDAQRRLVRVLVLSPLSVAPGYHHFGIGSALVRHALAAAAESDYPMVLLEGDPAFYGPLGFEPAAAHGITPPSVRIPPAACQVVLGTTYEPWMRGALVYADPFWAFDCVGLREEPGA